MLRKARDADRERTVEVLTDAEVRTYLGRPRRRANTERFLDQAGTADTTTGGGQLCHRG